MAPRLLGESRFLWESFANTAVPFPAKPLGPITTHDLLNRLSHRISEDKNPWLALAEWDLSFFWNITDFHRQFWATLIEKVCQGADPNGPVRWLDLGTAKMALLRIASETFAKLGRSAELHGMDISPHYKAFAIPESVYHVATLENLNLFTSHGAPLPRGYFDALSSVFALEYSRDWEESLRRSNYYLKRDGLFQIWAHRPNSNFNLGARGVLRFWSLANERRLFENAVEVASNHEDFINGKIQVLSLLQSTLANMPAGNSDISAKMIRMWMPFLTAKSADEGRDLLNKILASTSNMISISQEQVQAARRLRPAEELRIRASFERFGFTTERMRPYVDEEDQEPFMMGWDILLRKVRDLPDGAEPIVRNEDLLDPLSGHFSSADLDLGIHDTEDGETRQYSSQSVIKDTLALPEMRALVESIASHHAHYYIEAGHIFDLSWDPNQKRARIVLPHGEKNASTHLQMALTAILRACGDSANPLFSYDFIGAPALMSQFVAGHIVAALNQQDQLKGEDILGFHSDVHSMSDGNTYLFRTRCWIKGIQEPLAFYLKVSDVFATQGTSAWIPLSDDDSHEMSEAIRISRWTEFEKQNEKETFFRMILSHHDEWERFRPLVEMLDAGWEAVFGDIILHALVYPRAEWSPYFESKAQQVFPPDGDWPGLMQALRRSWEKAESGDGLHQDIVRALAIARADAWIANESKSLSQSPVMTSLMKPDAALRNLPFIDLTSRLDIGEWVEAAVADGPVILLESYFFMKCLRERLVQKLDLQGDIQTRLFDPSDIAGAPASPLYRAIRLAATDTPLSAINPASVRALIERLAPGGVLWLIHLASEVLTKNGLAAVPWIAQVVQSLTSGHWESQWHAESRGLNGEVRYHWLLRRPA